MRLLLITRDFPPHVGGIETWSYELSKCLVNACEDFALVAPFVADHWAVDRKAPFEVIRVPSTRHAFPGLLAVGLGGLAAHRQFDALLGAQWQTALPGLIWRNRGGPSQIFAAVRGKEMLSSETRFWPFAPRLRGRARELVLERIDGVFPVSNPVKELMARLGARVDHAQVVGSGCNAERFRPTPPPEQMARELGLIGRRVLLSVGRLEAQKGVDSVLFAVSHLGVRYPDLRYVIAGDGPDRGRLERLAAELRISHKVRFLGQVDEDTLPRVYNLGDIFIHATRQERGDLEGLNLVLLEAGATAKPIIATSSGGHGDAFAHEQTALLTPANDPTGLMEAISRLLEQPELSRQLGERARSRVLECSTWQRVADRLVSAMDQPRSAVGAAHARPVSNGARYGHGLGSRLSHQ